MESPPQPPPPPVSPSLLRRLIHLDTTVSLHLYTLTQPILPYTLLKTLELSGDGRFFFPLTLSLLLSPLSTTQFPFILNLLLGLLLDLLVIGLLKHLVRRPRPVYNKNMFLTFSVDHWSFPSGHSSRVFYIATFIFLNSKFVEEVLIQLRSNRVGGYFSNEWISKNLFYLNDEVKMVNYIVAIVGLWAMSTSVSRVLLGRHFVFDVVAGACLGVAEALIVFQVFNYETLRSVLW
ncbi:unnamed protein product [Ilex paraguariensis]|uniref:Phosphatidic acid phosphatase type 2/haloperoxidase domain-containing protein n=1 Tax=Ilex paraguariensis TaxID=185542 RepID=A0ABC8U026_9AQUA